jgi:mannose-1-phosphate guanylyltransferase
MLAAATVGTSDHSDGEKISSNDSAHIVRPFTSDKSNRWAVILAGGDGERLRPLTRLIAGDERPKQFCSFFNGETLLEQTRRRVAFAVPPSQTLITVTAVHKPFYTSLLSDMPPNRVIEQPMNKGTAPAILYSLIHLAAAAPTAAVAFFPSDHYFSDEERFMAHVASAFEAADLNPQLITLLGIAPENAEVEYGWIEPGSPISGKGAFSFCRVRRFWEKPSSGLALKLMAEGCLWNSFVMVGRAQALLRLIQRALPAIYNQFADVRSALNTSREESSIRTAYSEVTSTNFSRDVLTKCHEDLAVLAVSEVGWSDWGAPQRVHSTLARMGIRAVWSE